MNTEFTMLILPLGVMQLLMVRLMMMNHRIIVGWMKWEGVLCEVLNVGLLRSNIFIK